MKTLSILIVAILIGTFTQAQVSPWTKADRESLYNDYLSMLSKYKTVSQEQRESIALCALESTTTKYVKSDFASKIDVELKRIYESQISQCSKNIGVDLNTNTTTYIEPETHSQPTNTTADWTREDKQALSKDFYIFMAQYPNITESQKEQLALCFVQKTTLLFSKGEYAKLIDLETKQHKLTTLQDCSKGTSIDLSKTVVTKQIVTEDVIYKKQDIIGSWMAQDDVTYVFYENNTVVLFHPENSSVNQNGRLLYFRDDKTYGTYFVDEKGVITCQLKSVMFEYKMFGKTEEYNTELSTKMKIVFTNGDYIKLKVTEIDGKPVQDDMTYQMNKINNK